MEKQHGRPAGRGGGIPGDELLAVRGLYRGHFGTGDAEGGGIDLLDVGMVEELALIEEHEGGNHRIDAEADEQDDHRDPHHVTSRAGSATSEVQT